MEIAHGIFRRLGKHLHRNIVRLVLHEYFPLWICNPPDTIVVKLRPVVVCVGFEHGVFTDEISSYAPGRYVVGAAQGGEEVHELSTVTLFVSQGIESATWIPYVP